MILDTSLTIEKLPPHDEKAEQGLLGAVLADDADFVVTKCVEHSLPPDAFYIPAHRLLWKCFMWLHGRGRPIDLITVASALGKRSQLDAAGGNMFLMHLVDIAVFSHAEYYLKVILEKYAARQVIGIARETETAIMDEAADADIRHIIASEITALEHVVVDKPKSRTKKHVWMEIRKRVERARNGEVIGLPSPWPVFNKYSGGAVRSNVTLIVGRSKTRKSYISMQWGLHASVIAGIPGAYYPLEDGQERAMLRSACLLASMDPWRYERGSFTEDEGREVEDAAERIIASPFSILAGRGMTLDQRRLEIAKGVSSEGWQYVVIDAFKDMDWSGGDTKIEARISNWICNIAEEFDISVILVHHVRKEGSRSRDIKLGEWEKIRKVDARGSSQITDGARMIIALQCQLKRNSKGQNIYTNYVLDVLDTNYGQPGAMSMDVDHTTGRFTEAPERMPFSDWTNDDWI